MAERGSLELTNITKSYEVDRAELKVLDGINLKVTPGEFISIVGPSGCGKSTLLRLVVGLDDDYEGRIVLDNKPVVGTSLQRGIVFQDHRLLPWLTLEENVALSLENSGWSQEDRRRAVREHIALVGLNGFETVYPHQLSGGMAQRAALARALVNDPKLLLLDEPLGKLDSLTRLRMQNELLDLWKSAGFTALLVTHDVEEALLLADRVIVLSDRPASIVAEVRVDRPHPRRRDDADLIALRQSLLEKLGISHDV